VVDIIRVLNLEYQIGKSVKTNFTSDERRTYRGNYLGLFRRIPNPKFIHLLNLALGDLNILFSRTIRDRFHNDIFDLVVVYQNIN
jgi:hypothetical protein